MTRGGHNALYACPRCGHRRMARPKDRGGLCLDCKWVLKLTPEMLREWVVDTPDEEKVESRP